jgi:hypothetical protein
MKSIKAFFKRIIDKIKGLFKKEEELPPVRITPVVPPIDAPMPDWEKDLIEQDPRWDLSKKK